MPLSLLDFVSGVLTGVMTGVWLGVVAGDSNLNDENNVLSIASHLVGMLESFGFEFCFVFGF